MPGIRAKAASAYNCSAGIPSASQVSANEEGNPCHRDRPCRGCFGRRGERTTSTEPELTGLARNVSGNELTSDRDPAVILRFDPVYRYLGGQKFVLYGVADVEQHFFVETSADDKLKSMYWVQYEAYLPDNSYSYDYDSSPLRMTIGNFDFYTNTEIVEADPTIERRRGTDGAMVRQFLKSKGYAYPYNFAYARLVHLTDDTRRKELMIIFVNDLESYGLTAAELKDGGVAVSQRTDIEQAHIERIRETLEVL